MAFMLEPTCFPMILTWFVGRSHVWEEQERFMKEKRARKSASWPVSVRFAHTWHR